MGDIEAMRLAAQSAPAERIRQRRNELGISQRQLSQLADISTGYISQVENGRSNPSGRVMLRIASALKTTTDWILRGISPDEPPGENEALVVPSELSDAARQANLSYAATASVLKAYNRVIAQRRSKPITTPSASEWLDMYAALKRHIEG